ncbi:MAG: GTPase HflX [Bacteroidia bacterium]|jgi:GTP-binding protein HflX
MPKLITTARKQEKAVLIAVVMPQQKTEQADEYLDELAFLTHTAGARVVRRFMQRLPHPNPRTFIGEGKLNEVAAYIKENEIDMVIFDDELSPSQIRNLEHTIKCKIMDRSNLILDIFANRARTAQAKYQVELAQAQYLLPRLTRMWTHLSKQKGGIGMKGPGETEIETDRRALRNKIAKLKERLELIDKQSITRRQHRGDKPRIALVGYTNVGKSTILNLLAKTDVLAENKLFATLDSTVRKLVWDETPFLLTDTVGFIRKLPHQLIECFKSTLDEITEADLLLHIVDISHPNFEEQIEVVKQTLQEIHANKKPSVLVFNKIDLWESRKQEPDEITDELEAPPTLETLKKSWMSREHNPVVFISAEKKININELRKVMLSELSKLTKAYIA